MKISYTEVEGRIHFRCKAGSIEASGTVPKSVEKKGKEAIKDYAVHHATASIDRQTKHSQKIDAFCANPNFPVSIQHDGQQLKGKIVLVDNNRCLHVQLESPYQGTLAVCYGMASAMAGHRILTEEGTFSPDAIHTAKGLLVRIYKAEKHQRTHRRTIKVVGELNRGSRED